MCQNSPNYLCPFLSLCHYLNLNKSQIFRPPTAGVKVYQIYHVNFQTKSQFSLKSGYFSLFWEITLFELKRYMLLKNLAHQNANFQIYHSPHKNSPNCSCYFWNQESVIFQTLHHSSVFSVLFHLNLCMVWIKQANQSANFQTFDCLNEN